MNARNTTVLFVYSSYITPMNGGVERVTVTLADQLENVGFKVLYLSLNTPPQDKTYIDSRRQYFLPCMKLGPKANRFYKEFLIKNNINIVINQGAILDWVSNFVCRNRIPNITLISVLHNPPLGIANSKILSYKERFPTVKTIFEKCCFDNIFLRIYRIKHYSHYRLMYNQSDAIILLSKKFINEIRFLLHRKEYSKIFFIPNPNSFEIPTRHFYKKEKKVLYVGRIDTLQKKVNYLLDIWKLVYDKVPDWHLDIVGNGVELQSIIKYAEHLLLKNISFHGMQNPLPFYESSSLFCMTSSFEGFGLVLIEAMQEGVVPIAFNSFLSASDIIDNGINGFLITPFDKNEYANKLIQLMRDESLRQKLSLKAIAKSKAFSAKEITNKWIELFDHLENSIKNETRT